MNDGACERWSCSTKDCCPRRWPGASAWIDAACDAGRRPRGAGVRRVFAPVPRPDDRRSSAPKHKRTLEALLLKGAQAAGFHTDLWTCPRVADVVERRFGVHYHVDHVGRLLHELGWSPQKPARRAVERDEAAIRRWVQEKWPRVKKTPLAKGRRSSSSTKPDS